MPQLVNAPNIKEWVEKQLGWKAATPTYAVGIVHHNRLIGGVLYHNYTGGNCEMTIATTSPRWATRNIISELLAYPFEWLGCRRITAITDADNTKSKSMLERLGFQQEGVIREGSPRENGTDAIIYGLLKREYKTWARKPPRHPTHSKL